MTLDARNFGDMCIQNDGSGSEDCLSLNVFTPFDALPGDNLPVMVWIHGGALIQGSSSIPGYDVPALVNEGVVVVTINYRLNAFGFLPHPALEDPTGNFGLKDQVLGLRWVNQFIRGFGGNPQNITIFGESAGGHSVLSLLVAPSARGLFHKAIVQSGSYSPTQTALSVAHYTLGTPFADLNGYPDVIPDFPPTGVGPCSGTNEEIRTCLRDLTVAEVMAAQNAGPAWAWISPVHAAGTFLPKSIDGALTDGDIANVPVMIGSNKHEGTLFAGLFLGRFGFMFTESNYRAGVSELINPTENPALDPLATAVGTYYLGVAPGGAGGANLYRNAYSMIWTDATFTCNNLVQWGQIDGAGRTTYAYWFTDGDAPINPTYSALAGLAGYLDFGEWAVGASHSFEIQYIFGDVNNRPNVTAAQRDLSDRMIAYWTNFAKDGNPGGGWTAYNGTNIRALHPDGDSNATAIAFAGAHHCAFWANPFGGGGIGEFD